MKNPIEWKPSESDLAWCRRLLRMTKDGGEWRSDAGVYRIEHSTKRLVRTATGLASEERVHEMNRITFASVGYGVVEEPVLLSYAGIKSDFTDFKEGDEFWIRHD